MRYLIEVQYDGSGFYGFQRLKGKRTVQEELEQALSIINKKPIEIKGAGRTDKGVHSYGQRAHFDLDINIPLSNLKEALNDILDDDINISDIKEVKDDFHARFNVTKKIYEYKINVGKYDVLKHNYYLQTNYKIDMRLLKKCSKLFLGVHNFKNFVSGERDNYEAIIYSINIKKEKDIITIRFTGKSFYRYMVRNLVGAMLDVATGKAKLSDVENMLKNYNKKKNLSCARSEGLYLMKIFY